MTTMTDRYTLNPLVLRLALQNVRDIKAWHADYEEEVDTWYRSGPGRSPKWRHDVTEDGEDYTWNVGGQGYRFPHCIHGTDLWTPYDNICGGCESGYSTYEEALGRAWSTYRAYEKRCKVYQAAVEAGAPREILSTLSAWIVELVAHVTPKVVRNLP